MYSSDLNEYRAMQHARYLERERQCLETEAEETAKREAAIREAARKAEQANNAWLDIQAQINDIRQHVTTYQVHESVKRIFITVTDAVEKQILEKEVLSQLGTEVLDAVNTNTHITTDFSNPVQVSLSRAVKESVKNVLSLCNVILENEDLEVNYEMDTSRDAEIAQQLARERPDPPLPNPPRRRGRPRRNNVQ